MDSYLSHEYLRVIESNKTRISVLLFLAVFHYTTRTPEREKEKEKEKHRERQTDLKQNRLYFIDFNNGVLVVERRHPVVFSFCL